MYFLLNYMIFTLFCRLDITGIHLFMFCKLSKPYIGSIAITIKKKLVKNVIVYKLQYNLYNMFVLVSSKSIVNSITVKILYDFWKIIHYNN